MSETDRPFAVRDSNRLATQTDDTTLSSAELTLFRGVLGKIQSSVPKFSGRESFDKLGSWICSRKVKLDSPETLDGVLNGAFNDRINVSSKTLAFYPKDTSKPLTEKTLSELPLIPGLQVTLTDEGAPILVVLPMEVGAMHYIGNRPKGSYRDWISADVKSKEPQTINSFVVAGEGPGLSPTWQLAFSPQEILEHTVNNEDCTITVKTRGDLYGHQNIDSFAMIRENVNYKGGVDLIRAAFIDAQATDDTVIKTEIESEDDDDAAGASSSGAGSYIKPEQSE